MKRGRKMVDPVDKAIFPVTHSNYRKQGSRWVKYKEETEFLPYENTKYCLEKIGKPFERSHRLTKVSCAHREPYDKMSSISPDGMEKSEWTVDYAEGWRRYHKLRHKQYDRHLRYLRKKK